MLICDALFAFLPSIQTNLFKTLIEVHWMHRGWFSFSNSILSCLWFAFFLLQCWILVKPKQHLPLGLKHYYSILYWFCFFNFVLLALLYSFSEFQLFLWSAFQCVLVLLETSVISLSYRLKLLCLSAVSRGYFWQYFLWLCLTPPCAYSFRVLSLRKFSWQLFV